MLRTIAILSLPVLAFLGFGSGLLHSPSEEAQTSQAATAVIEKMIVASGNISLDVDLPALSGLKTDGKSSGFSRLAFEAERDAFFKSIFHNDELRGFLPGELRIAGAPPPGLPSRLSAAYKDLVIEAMPFGSRYELAVRDAAGDYTFFGIEGHEYTYDAASRTLTISGGRLLASEQFGKEAGLEPGKQLGSFTAVLSLRPIEVSRLDHGEVTAQTLPAGTGGNPATGTVPGPDVVVGDLYNLSQFGTDGSYVGLAVATDSCNFGNIDLNWFATPDNDHPVIPQNLYRISGGLNNDERFEQIGHSFVKHAFLALTENICDLGCNGVGNNKLGSGCSDPYSASLNAGPSLGSRAWINPFTGSFPRGDSATPPNSHTGHGHLSGEVGHRIRTKVSDLSTTQNPGAGYFVEAQYITPHEYSWCQQNPGQCNMYNNVSHRKYNVSGNGPTFSFSPAEGTQRGKAAVLAWPGASHVQFEPAPGQDGVGSISYKVTNPSAGVWHYEYAIYNQNLDRGVGSFSVPVGPGVTISNAGFHAPPQHPAWSADGTANNAGYSSTPWTSVQTGSAFTWSTETVAQNPNANAIRWGTMYNFRFDSNRPPANVNATIGFFKTGSPVTVQIQGPSAPAAPVSISGRVSDSNGRSVNVARVTLSEPGGSTRVFYTSSFGHFQFDNLTPGVVYTVNVTKRLYTFAPQTFTPAGNVTGANFNAAPR